MRRLLERLVPVYLALTAAFSARAQDAKPQPALIDGVVRDSSLVPIAAAEVAIVGTSVHVQTGDNGRFQIRNVPAGQYLIIVKHLGFHPTSGVVEVTAGDTLRL